MKIYKVQEIEWQEQSYSSLLLISVLEFLINHLILPPQNFIKYFFLIISVHNTNLLCQKLNLLKLGNLWNYMELEVFKGFKLCTKVQMLWGL